MKPYIKTDHFLLRQWERAIDDIELFKILGNVKKKISEQTHLFVGYQYLKKLKIRKNHPPNLVIVIQPNNVLVTLFFIEDFLQYVKSSDVKNFLFIA